MASKSMEEHKRKAPDRLNIGVITLSDSKFKDIQKNRNTDLSGEKIIESIEGIHCLVSYKVIPDDKDVLVSTIKSMQDQGVDAIITTGGTGIGSRDITIETLESLFEKDLRGFGEVFRYESYKKLGAGAILSRATAGIYNKILIIALPGSPDAVELGMEIILEELGHLVKHLRE